MTITLMALGGAIGANVRYLLDRWVQRSHDSTFPYGTLLVNIIGSLILGFLSGAALFDVRSEQVQAAVGVGLCGAMTTFSTFGYQTVRLFSEDARLRSIANVMISLVMGLGAAVGGMLAAAAIWA